MALCNALLKIKILDESMDPDLENPSRIPDPSLKPLHYNLYTSIVGHLSMSIQLSIESFLLFVTLLENFNLVSKFYFGSETLCRIYILDLVTLKIVRVKILYLSI